MEKVVIRNFLQGRFDVLQDGIFRRNEVYLVIKVILHRVHIIMAGELREDSLQRVSQLGFGRNAFHSLLNQILNLWEFVQYLGDVSLDSRHSSNQHLELILHKVPGNLVGFAQLR